MAAFGLPGGSELFVILTVIVLVFAPGLGWLGLGYLLGRRNTNRGSGAYTTPGTPPIEPAEHPGELPKEHVLDTPRPDDSDQEGPDADA